MTIHGSKDEIPDGQLKYTQDELDAAVEKATNEWRLERDSLRTQLEQASQNGWKLNGELLNTQTQLEKANHTIDALSGLICNINDTTRSRGFTTGPCDERVIALAQNRDALQTQLEEAKPLLEKQRIRTEGTGGG